MEVPEITPRPSLGELAAQASNGGGAICPGCGRILFAYKTETGKTRIIRYEACKTPGCGRRFQTRQPVREIIREIKPRNLSTPGIAAGENNDKTDMI